MIQLMETVRSLHAQLSFAFTEEAESHSYRVGVLRLLMRNEDVVTALHSRNLHKQPGALGKEIAAEILHRNKDGPDGRGPAWEQAQSTQAGQADHPSGIRYGERTIPYGEASVAFESLNLMNSDADLRCQWPSW